MFSLVLLFWVGQQMNAPTSYWVIWGLGAFVAAVNMLSGIYKAGKNSGTDAK